MPNEFYHKLSGGIATGIGSTPFKDAAAALEMIKKHLPLIPHWPQLPQRGIQEGLIFQAFRCLVDTGLLTVCGDEAKFDTAAHNWPERLTAFYTICLAAEQGAVEAMERFAFGSDAAAGFHAFVDDLKADPTAARFIKGQVVGPLTMGFQLKDGDGNLAFYDDELRDLVVRTLALHASWQCGRLAEVGLPVILFIDDPTVAAYGTHAHITLTKEMILESLDQVIGVIHQRRALVGIHSCDATDWSLLFATGTDIVSFDAHSFSESMICYPAELQAFLERGSRIAWGIVPTSEAAFAETEGTLLSRLYRLWDRLVELGVDRELLLRQSLITPACGTGLLSEELAERIYNLTAEVSATVMAKGL